MYELAITLFISIFPFFLKQEKGLCRWVGLRLNANRSGRYVQNDSIKETKPTYLCSCRYSIAYCIRIKPVYLFSNDRPRSVGGNVNLAYWVNTDRNSPSYTNSCLSMKGESVTRGANRPLVQIITAEDRPCLPERGQKHLQNGENWELRSPTDVFDPGNHCIFVIIGQLWRARSHAHGYFRNCELEISGWSLSDSRKYQKYWMKQNTSKVTRGQTRVP